MSAYLIAQLGKNFADGRNNRITGAEMLELAWSVIEEMQYMGGGMVVFLEANNVRLPALRHYPQKWIFVSG